MLKHPDLQIFKDIFFFGDNESKQIMKIMVDIGVCRILSKYVHLRKVHLKIAILVIETWPSLI